MKHKVDQYVILHNFLLEFGPAPAHLQHARGCLILPSGIRQELW